MNEIGKDKCSLVDAARELYLRLGIRSVSMDDIARQLGISKKTLYQTVDNKEELIQLVLESGASRDMAALQRHRDESADAIDEALRNSRHFIREMRRISPGAMHDLRKYYPEIFRDKVTARQDNLRQRVTDNLERGMEEGLYRDDLDAGVIANLYVGMTMMVVDRGVFPAQDRPISEIIRQHSTYHFNGIVNQFGRERLEFYLKQEDLF